jgi:hypothetical protein
MYTDGLSIPFFSMGRGVHSRTVSLTMTWTSRNRVTVPDWVLGARSAPNIVESTADEDVERGSTKMPKDTDQSTVDTPDTGTEGVAATVENVPGDIESGVTRRYGRGKDGSSPELVQVSVLFFIQSTRLNWLQVEDANDHAGQGNPHNGALDDNQIPNVRFPFAQ